MDEGMLITDLQAEYPPIFHVGLIAVRDMDTPPATHDRLIAVIKVLESMQVMEIPSQASMLTVDLERVIVQSWRKFAR